MEQVVEKQLEKLISLAAFDAKIAGLERKLEEIPKAIESRRETYLEAEKVLEAARDELSSMQKEHRKAEGDLDTHLEKIRKLSDQTGMVKTNKEYQAILGEIETLKKEQDSYEEKILELMEKIADFDRKIVVHEETVRGERKVFEEEEARLRAEGQGLERELAEVQASRGEVLSGVDPENLQLYSRVKGLRGNAVAEVKSEICLGCRVQLPPQKYADVIMSEVIQTCSHCQRILFHRKEGRDR